MREGGKGVMERVDPNDPLFTEKIMSGNFSEIILYGGGKG